MKRLITMVALLCGLWASAAVLAGECATPKPEWLVCEDFDSDVLAAHGWYDGETSGQTSLSLTPAEHAGGTGALEVNYLVAGADGSAAYRHMFPPQDKVYVRFYRKWPTGWVWPRSVGPHDVLVFASPDQSRWNTPSDNWFTSYIEDYYTNPPWTTRKFGTTAPTYKGAWQGYGIQDEVRPPITAMALMNQTFTPESVQPPDYQNGRWYCIEGMTQLNSATGTADGVIQMWLDGQPVVNWTGLEMRRTRNDLKLDQILLGPYFHGGVPAPIKAWYDNVVVSTARIGCLGSAPAPAPTPVPAPVSKHVAPVASGSRPVSVKDASGALVTPRVAVGVPCDQNNKVGTLTLNGAAQDVFAVCK